MNTLQVLLFIYSAVLVINILASLILLKLHSHTLFKTLIAIWGFTLVNFVLQGIFIKPGMAMYLSFSTYLCVSFSFCHFTHYILKSPNTSKKVVFSSLVLFGFGLINLQMTSNFTIASWLSSIAISLPMFSCAHKLWRSDAGNGLKALGILLFLNALHFLDYPILRSQPVGALFGFSFALIILFGFSTFLPGLILLQISKDYSLGLEIEVKERTKELEEALKQNKTLVNILCHDLSTPLTVLNFYFDEILFEQQSAIHTKYGSKAKRSLQTLLDIVAKVKELQAIGFGKKNIEFQKVDLNELVSELIIDFENQLADKKIKIEFINLTNSIVFIKGDRELLKNQILANLMSNAIKFSFEMTSILIQIKEENGIIEFSIEDRGIGIPDELIPNLFSLTQKTSRMGTYNEKGTGLGLPLVHACLEIMGGKIKVESLAKEDSEQKSGSKFIIQFEKPLAA